jgi:hypothetical protein
MGWYNSDGLYVKFGAEEGTSGRAGEYEWDGPQRFVELVVDGTTIGSGDVISDYNVVIPKGARIERVAVQVKDAFTSAGSATLNVGGYKTDNSAVDATGGFVAATALTTINADGKFLDLTVGATSAGTYIGTTLARNVYLSTKYATAAFTAGKAYVRIYYSQTTIA